MTKGVQVYDMGHGGSTTDAPQNYLPATPAALKSAAENLAYMADNIKSLVSSAKVFGDWQNLNSGSGLGAAVSKLDGMLKAHFRECESARTKEIARQEAEKK